MGRREFMTLFGAVLLSSSILSALPARTQGAAKLWRVGIILDGSRTPAIEGFVQGMHEFGHAEGRDYFADWRFADGRYGRFPGFAQEFVRLKADVIFLESSAAVESVQQVTRRIPIVMGYSIDPVGNHLVASLERPGANVTGMVGSRETAWPKQFDLLKSVVPNLTRVGVLLNPESSDYSDVLMAVEAAAKTAGIAAVPADARDSPGIESAFASFAGQRVEAVAVSEDGYFLAQQKRLAELALEHRLPSIYPERDYVQAGGLMSYGENLKEAYRRAASFVDRILKGSKPAELPIERVARQFVINRKAAAALGMMIPARIYEEADEVIE